MSLGGPTLGSVWVDIGGDASGFENTFRQTMSGAESQAKTGFGRLNETITGFGNTVIKTIGGAFAAAGAAGMVGLGIAIRGGLQRLVAIEEARAKLQGLGHDIQTIDTIMDNALQSVLGTAYRLDDAATTAASAVAAGIAPGEELERVLKLVGDTAQIAGTDFQYMGDRFARVAAQGRLTGDDLFVLGQRGLPILQWLQEEYGVTAEAARKMVSDGKVSFEEFADIIEKNIGGAALESGNTTMGAFRNMGAAAGRLGETLAGPVFRQARLFFNSMKDWIDDLNAAIKPAMETFENWLGPAFAKGLAAIDSFIRGLRGVAGELDPITGLVLRTGDAAHRFGYQVRQAFLWVSEAVSKAIAFLREYQDVWVPIAAAVGKAVVLIAGFAAAWALVAGALAAFTAAAPIAALVGLVAALVRAYETSDVFQARVRETFAALRDIVEPVMSAVRDAVDTFKATLEGGGSALDAFADAFEAFRSRISAEGVFDMLRAIFDDIVDWLTSGGIQMLLDAFVTAKLRFLEVAVDVFMALVDAVVQVIPEVVRVLSELIPKVVEALLQALPVLLSAGIELFLALVDAALEALPHIVAAIVELVPVLAEALVTAIPLLLDGAVRLFTAIAEAVPEVLPDIIDALVTVFPLIVNAILDAFPLLLDAAIQLFVALVLAVAEVLPDIVLALTDAIPVIVVTLLDALPVLLEAAVELFTAIVDALPIIIPAVVEMLVMLFPQVWDALIEMAPYLLMAAIEVFGVIVKAVWDSIPLVLAGMSEMGYVMAAWFSELPGKLWEAIKHFGSMLWDWAVEAMTDAWEGFKSIFGNSPGPLLNWFGEIPGKLVAAVAAFPAMLARWAREAMRDAWAAFRERWSAVMEWFRGIPERVITAVTRLIARMRTWARQVITAARTTLRERWAAVMAWFRNLPGRIITAVTSAIRRMRTWGRQIISAAYTAIRNRWQAVRTWFRGLRDRIRNAIPNPLTILRSIGRSILQGLWNGMTSKWNEMTGWIGSLGGRIAALKGPLSEDRKLLIAEGLAIMEGLGNGLRAGWVGNEEMLRGMAGKMKDLMSVGAPEVGMVAGVEGIRPAGQPRSLTPAQVEAAIGAGAAGGFGGGGLAVTQNIYTVEPRRAAADAVRKLRDAAYLGGSIVDNFGREVDRVGS